MLFLPLVLLAMAPSQTPASTRQPSTPLSKDVMSKAVAIAVRAASRYYKFDATHCGHQVGFRYAIEGNDREITIRVTPPDKKRPVLTLRLARPDMRIIASRTTAQS